MELSIGDTIRLIEETSLDKMGTKGANLRLVQERLGLKIPDTLVINVDFYKKIARDNNLSLHNVLGWEDLKINPDLEAEILLSINQNFGDTPLVIRSSATCEDTPFLSFAGQYSTFLNIKGDQNIMRAIKMCLCSLYSKNSITYSKKKDIDLDGEAIAVLVQKLVPVDMAGVIFTADPVSGDGAKISLEYTTGLGDKVLSGEKKPMAEVVLRGSQLQSPDLNKVVNAALLIEKDFGGPRDIEWGILNNEVCIFQNRPITTDAIGKETNNISGKLIGRGTSASYGDAKGRLLIIDRKDDLKLIEYGDIVYPQGHAGMDLVEYITEISGLITQGGILSHLSVIAREFEIPSICNFQDDLEQYRGKQVGIDGFRGELFL